MVELSYVLDQLANAGYRAGFFQRAEVRELCKILHEDEQILQATNGHYEGGFSLLVATDQRLILVDRKPMFLTIDSIAYSMIQEITFDYRLINSTIHVYTSNKTLDFSTWNHAQVRAILNHIQAAMRAMKMPPKIEVQLPEPVDSMKYEPIELPKLETDVVPTMPLPHHFSSNENTQSAYMAHSIMNAMKVSPTEFNIDDNSNVA